MKIKKIAAICTKTKWVELHDIMNESGETVQWVGNGSAMYRIDGVPYLSESSVMTLLDIPQDKRADFGKVHEEIDNDYGLHDDVNKKDTLIIPLGFTLDYRGGKLSAFRNEKDTVYLVNVRHLTPLGDDAELWERKIGDATYLVAKEGFLASAIIKPYEPPRDLLEKLESVTKGIQSQVEAQKEKNEEGE